MRQLLRFKLLLTAALVLGLMLLPGSGLHVLRTELPWLGRGLGWLETVSPRLDLDHVIAFALLAFSAGLAFPRMSAWKVGAALALFAAVTEVAQWWVPGRTASAVDGALDLAGALLGYTLARVLVARGRGLERPHPALPQRGRE